MGGGGWGGRACGARRAGGWVACLHAPPLAHGRPPLRRSPQRIEALVKCHADHPWAKYWNVCATQKILLDNCFREEKAINRWVGWVRGRVRGSGSAASQAGTQRGSSPHQPTCCLAARATLKSPSGRGSGCACCCAPAGAWRRSRCRSWRRCCVSLQRSGWWPHALHTTFWTRRSCRRPACLCWVNRVGWGAVGCVPVPCLPACAAGVCARAQWQTVRALLRRRPPPLRPCPPRRRGRVARLARGGGPCAAH